MWSFHQREEKEAFKIEGRAGEQESMEHSKGKVVGPVELELVCIGIKWERKLENIWCRIIVVLNATLGHMNVLTNRSHWRYLNRGVMAVHHEEIGRKSRAETRDREIS